MKSFFGGVNRTVSRRPEVRLKLSAIVDSIPRIDRGPSDNVAPTAELASGAQLGTLPFHDRVAAIGADEPSVSLRRSGRFLNPSVRLIPLTDSPALSRDLPSSPRPLDQLKRGSNASGATSTPIAHPVGTTPPPGGRRPPQDRLGTKGKPYQAANDRGTRGGASLRPTQPPELPVIERAIQPLRDAPDLVRKQE